MATPAGDSGNVGEYTVIVYQIDSSSDETDAGPCGLETRLHYLSPKRHWIWDVHRFQRDTPSADPAYYSYIAYYGITI